MSDYKCQQMICSLLLRKFREIPQKALPMEIAAKAKDIVKWCEDESLKFDHKLALGDCGIKLFTEFGIDSFSGFIGLNTNNEYIREYDSDLCFEDFDPLPTEYREMPSNGKWLRVYEFHRKDILCGDCPFYKKEASGVYEGRTYAYCGKFLEEYKEKAFPEWYIYWNVCEKHNSALFNELIIKPFKVYMAKQRAAIKETQPYRLLCYRISKRINEFVEYASNELIGTFNKYAYMKKYEMGKYREPLEGMLRNTFIEEYLEFDKPFNKFIIKYAKL